MSEARCPGSDTVEARPLTVDVVRRIGEHVLGESGTDEDVEFVEFILLTVFSRARVEGAVPRRSHGQRVRTAKPQDRRRSVDGRTRLPEQTKTKPREERGGEKRQRGEQRETEESDESVRE